MKYMDYNEQKQHGSADFPIQYYLLSPGHIQYVMPLHWHKEFEIVRVLSGSFRLYLSNTLYEMNAGDIILIDCGVLHRGDPEDCIYECAVFDPGMLRKRTVDAVGAYIQPLASGEMSARCRPKQTPELREAVGRLFSALSEEGEYYELEILSLLYRLFYLLYAGGDILPGVTDKKTIRRTEVMTSLLDWIEANCTEPINLADLARVSGMSEKYLCRFFKAFTARSPIDYINCLRVENACHEMSVNRLTVTEAALASGFGDLSYFSRVFRKYRGVTPKEYRRSQLGAQPPGR